MTDTAEFPPESERPAGWLRADQIASARQWLPILYVDAVPVRVGVGVVGTLVVFSLIMMARAINRRPVRGR